MQGWQTVAVVCVAVSLVSQGATRHPRAAEEAGRQTKDDVSHSDAQERIPEGLRSIFHMQEYRDLNEEAKRTRDVEEETRKIDVPKESEVRREPVSVGEKKEQLLGMSMVEPEKKQEVKDDVTRSKKSPDMRELALHAHPTTTVCIQVRADQPGQVVCGPQVGDDKKAEKTIPTSPRFAYPTQVYDPRYLQGEQIPLPRQNIYMRVKPEDIEPSRPFSAQGKPPMMKQQQMIPQGPAMSPMAARGPNVFRRTQPEEDTAAKLSEGPQPAAPPQPIRIIPQPPPASVVVHKQYYQAAPLPTFSSNLIAPAPSPLRLNCALQPEGAQYLQTYGTPLLRNSAPGILPGYFPLSEVIIPDGPNSRSAQIPAELQGYYYDDPQARAAQMDDVMASPYDYVDPMVGTTFVGEDGQLYRIDEPQVRSAADEQDQAFRAAPTPSSDMKVEDFRAKLHEQDKQVKEAAVRLEKLQKQMEELTRREEEKKKHSPAIEPLKDNTPVKEASPDPSDEVPKKAPQNKNIKRQSYHSFAK